MKIQLMCSLNFFLLFFGCGNDGKVKQVNLASKIAYTISKPDRQIQLANELEEISDISFLENGNLVCIQDEKGIIYELNASDGEIVSKNKFSGPEDFEGLAITGNTAFAVTSSGVIYEIKDFRKEDTQVERYETALTEYNNVEGVCYDKETGKLLLVLKGHPGAGLNHKEYKTVYSFDIKSHVLDEDPLIQISLKKLSSHPKKESGKKSSFSPSGIAIHPVTGNYFIIASVGKLLVEMNRKLEIVGAVELPEAIFVQPEGITFDQEGGMYISNEAKGGTATILYFEQK